MATVYRYELLNRERPRIYADTAETLIVEGQPYVRLRHGTMIPKAGNWHLSLDDAKQSVVAQLREQIEELNAQILEFS
jgi:hypothetical protein